VHGIALRQNFGGHGFERSTAFALIIARSAVGPDFGRYMAFGHYRTVI
jgi:hypothetical protein